VFAFFAGVLAAGLVGALAADFGAALAAGFVGAFRAVLTGDLLAVLAAIFKGALTPDFAAGLEDFEVPDGDLLGAFEAVDLDDLAGETFAAGLERAAGAAAPFETAFERTFRFAFTEGLAVGFAVALILPEDIGW